MFPRLLSVHKLYILPCLHPAFRKKANPKIATLQVELAHVDGEIHKLYFA